MHYLTVTLIKNIDKKRDFGFELLVTFLSFFHKKNVM